MGGVFTVPHTIATAISEKGIFYCFQYAVFYIYITVKNFLRKKRFDLYDFQAVGQPEVNGFLIAKEEWKLDSPSKYINLEEVSDDAFIHGTNSKSDYFAVYIRRLPENQVHYSLFLRTADGNVYSLPKEHATQKASSEDNTFGSSRLKLQCLLPMRKWRIFFNGILEERTSEENVTSPTIYKHTKFSFIWTASSEVFDFKEDLPKTTFSHIAGSSSCLKSPMYYMDRLNECYNFYEQPGMILGTLHIENEPEKELYLWGARQRFMAKPAPLYSTRIEIFGNFRDGKQLHLAVLDSVDKIKRVQYGYIMDSKGFVFPICDFLGDVSAIENEDITIKCYSGNQWHEITIKQTEDQRQFRKGFGLQFNIKTTEMTMDGRAGRGFVFTGNESKLRPASLPTVDSQRSDNKLPLNVVHKSFAFCLPFDNALCRKSNLTGGKGSSLGHLYEMSLRSAENGLGITFHVPKGIVVSTIAYKEFIKSLRRPLYSFERNIWAGKKDTASLCRNIMELVTNADLPKRVSTSIVEGLTTVFGENISDYKFAVRSSATGEDTEQMSAAGQMETFLGIKGIDEILLAVKKCWASQFSFQAVEYKRGYGQLINTPMAVVIQEMVPCETAGVIFTCDPVSGNPSFVSITANYGLGESVVSASADPDTVMLHRNIDNALNVHSKEVGNKKTKIIMDGECGTKEIEIDENDTSAFCINEDMALKLGKISVAVEKYYGTPRDIEWGIAKENIFLFQSRPVTSLDMDTDFEIKHFFDTFQRTERSFWSKANVGEVMPGATSPLTLDLLHRLFDTVYQRRTLKMDEGMHPQKPYFQKSLTYAYGQVFINLLSGQFRFGKQEEEETRGFMISLFGRLLSKDLGIIEESLLMPPPEIPFFKKLLLGVHFLYLSFFSGIILRRGSKAIEDVSIPCENMDSAEILKNITLNWDIAVRAMSLHLNCSFSSSFWNMSMLSLLTKVRGAWDNVAFSDFAYLLSTCDGVESATIPAAIQDIGVSISKEISPDEFKMMSVEQALNWLNNNLADAGMKFRNFLERHGHRCLKEFDVYVETWGSDPTPVIKMLQKYVSKTPEHAAAKEPDSFSTVLSELQIKFNFKDRLRLRWLLPNSRRGVRERENAKSLCILSHNILRKPYHKMAEVMVSEGRLPRKELMFFLCVDEIRQLIRTRSPRLITRATRRYKAHKELDELKFPEICDGIPKPINGSYVINVSGKGFKMTGVPVSQGIVKAQARVVMNLEEAKSIQQGDILITYSTDIGWSPYFPLLSGVVTELGGLISHGAVVAREYGLPCVVGLHGATRAFKSGDLVILDGTNGTLQKSEEE